MEHDSWGESFCFGLKTASGLKSQRETATLSNIMNQKIRPLAEDQ